MTLNNLIAYALDRPGGRTVLSHVATWYSRHFLGEDLKFIYRDVWMHKARGGLYFPSSEAFTYNRGSIVGVINEIETLRTNCEDFWFHFQRPSAGDVIVDVGAGRGEDVLGFSEAVGATGIVYAIEAHPKSYRLLSSFLHENRLSNVRPIHAAIVDRPGYVGISDLPEWESNEVSWAENSTATAVHADTLDNICAAEGITKIDFLKMNIEGAERDALKGMQRTLLITKAICIACHDFRTERGEGEQFRTRQTVEETLVNSGFELFFRADDVRPYVRDHVFGYRAVTA